MSSDPRPSTQFLQPEEDTAEINDSTTKFIILGVSIIIIVIGTIGNGFVIYVFGWVRRKGRPVVEFIFLLLAFTDLVCCLIAAPIQTYDILAPADGRKEAGSIIRKYFIPTFWPMSFLLSQGLLVIICIDRYRAVVYPFKERMKPKVIALLYLGLFLVGFALYSPFSFVDREDTKSVVKIKNRTGRIGTRGTGNKSLVKNKEIFLIRSVIELSRDLIGLVIMVVLIYKMLKSLKERQKELEGSHQEGYIEARNKSVRKTLVTVIVVFATCVLPFDIAVFGLGARVFFFGKPPVSHDHVLSTLFLYLRTLQIANCCANVFIYSFIHPTFAPYRSAVTKRMCYGFQCCHEDVAKDSELRPIKQSSTASSPVVTRSYSLSGKLDTNQDGKGH